LIDLRNQLREFLTKSTNYETITILHFLEPIATYLNKEHAILKMKLGRFGECFDICIGEISYDIAFAEKVANKGFEWHDKSAKKLIYYNLFKRLLDSKDPDHKKLAIQILTQNCQHIPYEKLTKNFNEEDNFDKDMNILFIKVFEQMDSQLRQSIILKNLS
jgi:hypothetical protein